MQSGLVCRLLLRITGTGARAEYEKAPRENREAFSAIVLGPTTGGPRRASLQNFRSLLKKQAGTYLIQANSTTVIIRLSRGFSRDGDCVRP